MNYYDFNELNNTADISTLRRISSNPKLIKTPGGNELHDCCPFTGDGNDRFWINLDRKPMTWNCRRSCPGCTHGGDAMQFIAIREHLNRKTDALKIAAILAEETGASPSPSCNVSRAAAAVPQQKEAPRTLTPPPQQWQKIADSIVKWAAGTLQDATYPEAVEALQYLHDRGITDKMIERYRIGYIPTQNKYFGFYVDLSTGYREKRKPNEGENFIWVPEGITIPTYLKGELYRVKVRKLNRRAAEKAAADDLREPGKAPHDEHYYRYSNISGAAGTDTALFNGDAAAEQQPKRDILFVEGELDAILINGIMQGQGDYDTQAVTFGSASKTASFETYYRYFRTPARIVIAYDNDDPGRTGADHLLSEIMQVGKRETLPVIKTIPDGYKDFGEYYAAGGNIYQLIASWFPL